MSELLLEFLQRRLHLSDGDRRASDVVVRLQKFDFKTLDFVQCFSPLLTTKTGLGRGWKKEGRGEYSH
jgi:hypothetical protein